MRSDECGASSSEISGSHLALIVPKRLVKRAKDALESHLDLDKSIKIRPATLEDLETNSEKALIEPRAGTFFVPTKFSARVGQVDSNNSPLNGDLLWSLGLVEYEKDISITAFKHAHGSHGFQGAERGCIQSHQMSKSEVSSRNPLARTIRHWLHQLPPKQPSWPFAAEAVLSCSWTYMMYPPLLLLPPSTLSNLTSIFASKSQSLPEDLSSLWYLLSKEFKASHVALNAPIPASSSKESSSQGSRPPKANILRSPTDFVPLYGDFGPNLPLYHNPTATDFSLALWCSARQNNIFQTWAPRYTMFSRGNISEKARILSLHALTEERSGSQPGGMSAVDLYAGIGYFAFSYAMAGIDKVLCWEINPWSIEGLKRGAKRNCWGVRVIKGGQTVNETIDGKERFIVFQESNEHAAGRVAAVRDSIPPVRHVNCGLLPSSEQSWESAVQVLDPMGGWIHVHENIAKADIENRTEEVVEIFTLLVNKYRGQELEVQWEVKCEHVEQVKSYAPGVVHCVLDISVSVTKRKLGESPSAFLDLS